MHAYVCSCRIEIWQAFAVFRFEQQRADMDQLHKDTPPLDFSVAQVQHPTMGSSEEDWPFLMSSGRGDMVGPLQHIPGLHHSVLHPFIVFVVWGSALICEMSVGADWRKYFILVGFL